MSLNVKPPKEDPAASNLPKALEEALAFQTAREQKVGTKTEQIFI
jgi:hypothetical protein